MANVLVTDKWIVDPRRERLAEKVGSLQADGVAIRAWRLGFEYFKKGQALVPESVYSSLPHADAFLEVGLAERRDGGIYIRGSIDEFGWYEKGIQEFKEHASKAGKKSAEVRKAKYGTAIPQNASNLPKPSSEHSEEPNSEQTPNTFGSENRTRRTPPKSPSPSLLLLKKEDTLLTQSNAPDGAVPPGTELETRGSGAGKPARGKKPRFSPETSEKMRAFFAMYAERYKAKYGGNPEGIRDPVMVGRIGNWIAGVSRDRAVNLAEAYLQIEYKFFEDRYHDLDSFLRNLNRIGSCLDTGKVDGQIDWRSVFEREGRAQ
jgi:hypothetical protein